MFMEECSAKKTNVKSIRELMRVACENSIPVILEEPIVFEGGDACVKEQREKLKENVFGKERMPFVEVCTVQDSNQRTSFEGVAFPLHQQQQQLLQQQQQQQQLQQQRQPQPLVVPEGVTEASVTAALLEYERLQEKQKQIEQTNVELIPNTNIPVVRIDTLVPVAIEGLCRFMDANKIVEMLAQIYLLEEKKEDTSITLPFVTKNNLLMNKSNEKRLSLMRRLLTQYISVGFVLSPTISMVMLNDKFGGNKFSALKFFGSLEQDQATFMRENADESFDTLDGQVRLLKRRHSEIFNMPKHMQLVELLRAWVDLWMWKENNLDDQDKDIFEDDISERFCKFLTSDIFRVYNNSDNSTSTTTATGCRCCTT